MASFPLYAAIRTVKAKIGTWVGYDRYVRVDPTMTRDEWGRLVGQARAALANRVAEATRPLNRRPTAAEITPYDTRDKTGYLQYLDVYVKDAHTGLVRRQAFTLKTQTLMSRGAVIRKGLEVYETSTLPGGTFEGETVLDASYAGTVQLLPRR